MRTRWILMAVGILAIVVAAAIQFHSDFTVNASTGTAASSQTRVRAPVDSGKANAPAGGVFFVRMQTNQGEMVLYDTATARPRLQLPAEGKFSADRTRYFFARPESSDGYVVESYDVDASVVTRLFSLPGKWSVSGVSSTGRWLALLRAAKESEDRGSLEIHSHIEILDTRLGAITHTIDLAGEFSVDAISPDGSSLFLIRHLPAPRNNNYEIRLYDLTNRTLVPDPLREKGEDEVMEGSAYQQVATPDGGHLLTLYVDSVRHVAFIHDLDLENKSPTCIDLPSGAGNTAELGNYSLAVSPDGKQVYAINVSMGVIVEVDLVERVARKTIELGAFAPSRGRADLIGDGASPTAVSKDGKRLFFADRDEVWAFDTAASKITDNYQLAASIYGLGANDNGHRLFVVTASESARMFIVPQNGTLVPLE